ncbi:MAG: hypothetical protein AB1607_13010 [Chloroflexota bacterium]
MKIDTVSANSLLRYGRLDSKYYLSPAIQAKERIHIAKLHGLTCRKLGGKDGLAEIWQPNRFKRAYAAPLEEKAPYLRPYDVFEFLPTPADWLSVTRNKDMESYILKRGMILQSCSGRNLGPAIFVDEYLARFIVGDDMIRIEIENERIRYYVLAFLKSPTGQNLLKQGKTGSVIDHLSKDHVSSLEVPFIAEDIITNVATLMKKSIESREKARLAIDKAITNYEDHLPKLSRIQRTCDGWTVRSRSLSGRLDAAYYDPLVKKVKKELLDMGGKMVRDVADVIKPPGRYKTLYVGSEYGLPLVSGTQLLQDTPINLRYMPAWAFNTVEEYMIKSGWIAYQADGRAEETLGLPVLITKNRNNWLASGHIGRLVPKRGVSSGWIFLALRTKHAQLQIKSTASGSVVDSTFPEDMESVVLPPQLRTIDSNHVEKMWDLFSDAELAELQAVKTVENALNDTLNKKRK